MALFKSASPRTVPGFRDECLTSSGGPHRGRPLRTRGPAKETPRLCSWPPLRPHRPPRMPTTQHSPAPSPSPSERRSQAATEGQTPAEVNNLRVGSGESGAGCGIASNRGWGHGHRHPCSGQVVSSLFTSSVSDLVALQFGVAHHSQPARGGGNSLATNVPERRWFLLRHKVNAAKPRLNEAEGTPGLLCRWQGSV